MPKQSNMLNLNHLSMRDLMDLEKALLEAKQNAKAEFTKKLDEFVKRHGFVLADFLPKRIAAKSQAKFANPDDPNETWTGNGRHPKWLTNYLDEGGTITDLLIENPTKPKKKRRNTGKKLPIIYMNPMNPHQTWTGRGKIPQWMTKLIDGEITREKIEKYRFIDSAPIDNPIETRPPGILTPEKNDE